MIFAGGTALAAPPLHVDDGSEYEPEPAPKAVEAPRPLPKIDLPIENGMLRLPAGRFTMGTNDPNAPPNERPARTVSVASFWLDKTEVTVGAYRTCVDAKACKPLASKSPTCTFGLGDPDLPITCVPWKEADAFCRARAKRLPREAEWEYAARGTNAVRYPWGYAPSCTAAATLIHDATARSCSGTRPSKVGTHPTGASTFGILDLCGNAEEWTSDWYVETPAEGAAPRAGASHVLRGGGWLSTPSMSKTTSRNWGSSLEAGPNVGFRCARD